MAAYQGTYYSKTFAFKDTDGDPVDINGWTFEADIRDRLTTDVLLNLTTDNGGFTVVDGPEGTLQLAITAAQTATLPAPTKLIFDVLRTDIVPGPIWLFAGKFSVKQPVTRDDD